MNRNKQSIFSQPRIVLLSLSFAVTLAGCKSKTAAPDDATLNSQVQSRFFSDQNLIGQSIQTTVSDGVVTLNGTVTSDTARSSASSDAAQVAGVKTVVNNLTTQAAAPVSAQVTTPPPPAAPQPLPTPPPSRTIKPSPSVAQPAPVVRNYSGPPQPSPQAQYQPPSQPQYQPPPQMPPPERVIHTITLPTGTSIPVRITENLDSATSQSGDRFTGSVASDIIVDGMVVLPQGTPVSGRVDEVHDAGHFKGNSLLTISLSSIQRHGERIDVATDAYSREGEGRGKNTAEKVGGGAAVGAILGGIFGGGKGAAIGAAAGGGVGAGANGVTRGQQVQISSETVVRFRLANSILVHVGSGDDSHEGQSLEHRDNR
jgi:hypothetical protein